MLKLSPRRRTLAAAIRDSQEKKELVRIAAVRDLGVLANDDASDAAVEALERVLAEDAVVAIQAEAAVALADAGAKRSLPRLIEAATDGAPRVRQMALIAVGELAEEGDEAAVAVVASAFRSEAPALRFQALIALCRLSREKSREAIVRGTRDDDAEVRCIALRLAEERWAGEGELPSDIRARAEAALDDESPRVQLLGAILLIRSGSERGGRAIADAVAAPTGTHDPEDEQAAVEIAGELGLADARAGLESRAFGLFSYRKAFAWQARVALARMGHARARQQILRELQSWSRDRRTMAVAAAGRAHLIEAREEIAAMGGDERRADPTAVREALDLLDG